GCWLRSTGSTSGRGDSTPDISAKAGRGMRVVDKSATTEYDSGAMGPGPPLAVAIRHSQAQQHPRNAPWYVRWRLTGAALLVLTILVIIPVACVFYNALQNGFGAYWRNLADDPDTRHSILLTLAVAPTAVLLNLIFGLAAAWAIARFRFPGRTALITLID